MQLTPSTAIESAAQEANVGHGLIWSMEAEQLVCDWQVEQRQKEYQALRHGAVQRLQQWKDQMLQQQGD